MKKLICWLRSHDYPEWTDAPCDRCGHFYEYGEALGVIDRLRFFYRYGFKQWVHRKREWLKCPDCGKRFGKHDDTKDHIPF